MDVFVSKTGEGQIQVVFRDTTGGTDTLALQQVNELKDLLQMGKYRWVVMVTENAATRFGLFISSVVFQKCRYYEEAFCIIIYHVTVYQSNFLNDIKCVEV